MILSMEDNWILRPRPNPQARYRLFCFHPAGRGASGYVPWANLLSQEIDLCCIQLPGRENRLKEPPLAHLNTILEGLDPAITRLLDRPYAFFGASMGALIGFELARKLRRNRQILPKHLFLASRPAPQTFDRLPPISRLQDDFFLEEMQKRYNNIPQAIRGDPELIAIFLPTLRADFSVIETYSYNIEPALDCPLTVLRGSEDSVVLEEDIQGWGEQTRNSFSIRTFPGGHFFLYNQPVDVVGIITRVLLK